MKSSIDIFRIREVPHFLDEIKSLGRKNSASLGLFPAGAFDEHAHKNHILVALNKKTFCGYLLFRASRKPYQLSIVQLCICDEARGFGCSEFLINKLKQICREGNYPGITLNCRKDYTHARNVWERNQFYAASEKRGRGRIASVLTTWWWNNPDSFDLFSGLEKPDQLFRVVIDLNILIELKEFESLSNSHLTSSWLLDEIIIYVTPEIFNEIDRTIDPIVRNETKAFAKQFDCIDCDDSEYKSVLANISGIVTTSDKAQNKSDRRQLAWSIIGNADYFLTRDSYILAQSENIYNFFPVKVLEPERLALSIDQLLREEMYSPYRLSGTDYRINKASEQDIQRILTNFIQNGKGERRNALKNTLLTLCNTVGNPQIQIVEDGDNNIEAAFGYRINGVELRIELLRMSKGKLKDTIGMQLLDQLIVTALKSRCSLVIVTDIYHSIDISIFNYFGFYRREKTYVKIVATGLHELKSKTTLYDLLDKNLDIPKDMLPDPNLLPEIGIGTEKMFWPLKIASDEIKSYVISIRPEWAKQLFDVEIAEYDFFGADPFLQFNVENVYYSASKIGIQSNSRILWYVTSNSNEPHSGALRAISYIDEVSRGVPKELFSKYRRLGVYEWGDVLDLAKQQQDRKLMAIKFSRSEKIVNPVNYQTLQEISINHRLKKLSVQSPQLISVDMFAEIYNNYCAYIQ